MLSRLSAKKVLLLSMALVIVGNALLTQISAAGSYLGVEPGMIFWSLGASIGFPVLYIIALSGTKPGEEGLASGLITTSQRVGFPLGLAILISISSIASRQPVGSGGDSVAAIVAGFRYAFVAATILSIVGLLIVLFLKNVKQQQQMPITA